MTDPTSAEIIAEHARELEKQLRICRRKLEISHENAEAWRSAALRWRKEVRRHRVSTVGDSLHDTNDTSQKPETERTDNG